MKFYQKHSDVIYAIKESWSKETAHPDYYDPNIPCAGQCAVTALVIADLLGIPVVREDAINPRGTTGHYFNQDNDKWGFDLTFYQYDNDTEFYNLTTERNGVPLYQWLLTNEDTKRRYLILKDRVEKYLRNEE